MEGPNNNVTESKKETNTNKILIDQFHSNKYLLSAYYVPDSVPGTDRPISLNKHLLSSYYVPDSVPGREQEWKMSLLS